MQFGISQFFLAHNWLQIFFTWPTFRFTDYEAAVKFGNANLFLLMLEREEDSIESSGDFFKLPISWNCIFFSYNHDCLIEKRSKKLMASFIQNENLTIDVRTIVIGLLLKR